MTIDSTPNACHSKVVMVGVDGSAAASDACSWAAWLAAKTDAHLITASAWLPHQAEGSPEAMAERRAAAESMLDDEWSRPARLVGVSPRPLLLDGTPEVLLEAAEHEHADLLVVGSRGAGGLAGLHVGSVAHHLAHHTVRPLAIVPAPAAHDHPGTIVVGVDGSAGSAAAVRWCATTAAALSAEVIAVTAFEPFLEWVPDSDPRNWRRDLGRHMDEWIEPLLLASVQVQRVIVRDIHPVAAIADTARGQAQLIVVGTHGRGGFPGMRVGGVALQLVHHAALPVVLVPGPGHDASSAASTGRIS